MSARPRKGLPVSSHLLLTVTGPHGSLHAERQDTAQNRPFGLAEDSPESRRSEWSGKGLDILMGYNRSDRCQEFGMTTLLDGLDTLSYDVHTNRGLEFMLGDRRKQG